MPFYCEMRLEDEEDEFQQLDGKLDLGVWIDVEGYDFGWIEVNCFVVVVGDFCKGDGSFY